MTQRTYSYSSDDVSWQTTLLSWSPFSGQQAYVGVKDNFLVNTPFILLFEHIFKLSRTQLVAEALFFALLNFILFYIAALYFLKKLGVQRTYASLSPFLWLASFGSGLSTVFLNPDWRDYEFGLSFIFYMTATKYYYDEITPFASIRAKLLTVLLFSVAVLFTYSDPYFLYFTLAPVAVSFITLFLLGKVRKPKVYMVLAFTLSVLVASRILVTIASRAGILTPHGSMTFTSLSRLGKTLNQLVSGLEDIFSINFSRNALLSLGNAILLISALAIIGLWAAKRRDSGNKEKPGSMLKQFFGLLGILSIAAYVAVGNANVGNSRYLVMFVYTSVLLIALNMRSFNTATVRFLVITLLVTAGLNTISTVSQVEDSKAAAETVNGSNYQLIDTLKQLGFTKGYAGYWDSDINTYLSSNTIEFLPITCSKDTTVPLPLLVNGGLFNHPTTESFLVVDPTNGQPKTCTEAEDIAQFGFPEREVKVKNDTILLYDYDLVTKMPYSL